MKFFEKCFLLLLALITVIQANIQPLTSSYNLRSSEYGVRYYDPRTSVWQSHDPILNEYMDGKPNGGVFNPKNLNMFGYTYSNPVNLVDPDGNYVIALLALVGFSSYANAPAQNDEVKSGATPAAVLIPGERVAALAGATVKSAPKVKAFAKSVKTGRFAKTLIKSKTFGIGSKLFGNSKAGKSGILNKAKSFIKIGWSGGKKEGGKFFRIGIGKNKKNPNKALFHIKIPGTLVKDKIADKIVNKIKNK